MLTKDMLVLGLQEWFRRLTTGKMPVARRTCLLLVTLFSSDPESVQEKGKMCQDISLGLAVHPSEDELGHWA